LVIYKGVPPGKMDEWRGFIWFWCDGFMAGHIYDLFYK